VRLLFYATDASHWEGKSRVMIFQPGNLPVVWYREVPGSRGIGRTAKAGCLFFTDGFF